MRLVFLLWTLFPLLVWTGLSIFKQEMKTIDPVIVQIIGILAATKAIQRFGEKQEENTPELPNN